MLSEADIRLEIDEALKNKGWTLSGQNKNVFTEKSSLVGRVDYILKPKDRENPLVIIEAKKKGKDLNAALKQAQRYAEHFKSPIAYATDGSTIKTIHLSNLKPLILNGEEIDEFVSESLALQFLYTNEYNTIGKQVIKSRKELINIFASANKELRKEGLQAGIERFSEFCNILFLKIFSEEEDTRCEKGIDLRIPKEFNWNYFKNKDGNELLSYVNDTVLKHFQKEYGTDIFTTLQIKNPITLKKIIDSLDPLSLVDTNSDIKGDAFEYFLRAYLANQNKDLGEYFTPRHIVKTLVKLVNPKFGETVYDPFCGTGGMLIEAFRHIYNKMPRNEKTLQQLRQETIYGSEITKNARITKMNMILTGDGHNNILQQDSLKNPSRKKYDIVITNMPFSLGSYEEYSGLYKLGSSNGNSLCIEHCFNAIDLNSGNPRIAIIVPEGILFDKKFKKLREYIYRNSYVKDIVSLPSGAFKPYTDVKTSILHLAQVNHHNKTQKSVWHYTVKNDGYTLNTKRRKKEGENDLDLFLSFYDVEDEDNLLHRGFNRLNLEEIKNNDYISIPNPYIKFQFNSEFKNINIGQLIEELTLKNTQDVRVWSVTNKNGGSFIWQDEQFNEQVASTNRANYKIVPPNSFAYSPPRINVGSIAFNDSQSTGCVSPIYIVFKILNESILNTKYLYWLFQSQQFRGQIKNFAFGSVRHTVSFDDFCKITIPLPTIDEQQRIVEELESYYQIVKSTTTSIDSWKPYIKIEKDWQKVKLKDILQYPPQYGISKNMNDSKIGYKILRMGNLQSGELDLSDIKYVDIENSEFEKYRLKKGDLLFNRTNSFELVGKTSIFDSEEEYCFASYLVRIAVDREKIREDFLNFFMNTTLFQRHIKSQAKQANDQANINPQILIDQIVPLPSLGTQKNIADKLGKEKLAIKSQKEIVLMFQDKIAATLDSIWRSAEETESVVYKSVFDMLTNKASKPS